MYFISVGTYPAPFFRLLESLRDLPDDMQENIFYQGAIESPMAVSFEHDPLLSRRAFRGHLNSADLVVIHAGIGSIYESFLAGKKTIVVPRLSQYGEHENDHQLEIVSQLRLAPLPNVYVLEDLSRLRETLSDVEKRPIVDITSCRLGESLRAEVESVVSGWVK